jgi:hypothetical protein
MGHFVPALNGPCSYPPMGRDLDLNLARYNGSCRSDTKIFRIMPCLGRVFFSVLRAGPSGPAQIYTYTPSHGLCPPRVLVRIQQVVVRDLLHGFPRSTWLFVIVVCLYSLRDSILHHPFTRGL